MNNNINNTNNNNINNININRSDPRNRPNRDNEEMKQADPQDTATGRLLQAEAIRRELGLLNAPSQLFAGGNRSIGLHHHHQQFAAGNPLHVAHHQGEPVSRLAMEQALLGAQQRGLVSRTSLLGDLHHLSQPGQASVAAAAALADANSMLPNLLVGAAGNRVPSPSTQLRMYGGDNRHHHQLQAENLLLEQHHQHRQNVMIGSGSIAPAAAVLSNASVLSPASRAAGMTFQLEGNLPNHSQSSVSLEERIASHADLLSSAGDVVRPRASSTTELKEEEKAGSSSAASRPSAGDGADEGDEQDSDASDHEEDALDDDAFYLKRNSVETIEDLRLQNETFPVKLYRMLYEVEKNGKADVVSFLPHGRSFAIHKQNEFSTILPEYFATDRMASFQRQLNLYGFRRITEGKDKGAFFHEKFIHGKRSLCKKIKRKRGSRRSSSSSSLRRTSQTSGSSSSLTSQHSLLQQHASSPVSRLSASAWGRSIAAGQGTVGSSLSLPLTGAVPDERSLMLGGANPLGSGSDMLNLPLGGVSGARGLNATFTPTPLSASSSSSLLQQQQQQMQQRLRQQQELEQRLMLERERARRGGSQQGPP